MELSIHNLDTKLSVGEKNIVDLIERTANKLKMDIQSVHIIFVDDEKLRTMHEYYLGDPDYTDVMTFNLGNSVIEAEIYISTDRVKDNAKTFEVSIENEILRTIIHGLLHLKGYKDKEDHEKKIMKQREEELLNQLYRV